MQIKKSVYKQMMRSFSPAPPERGGMIGMENGTICAYMHDDSEPIENRAKYKPNVPEMNRVLTKWRRKGILFAGLVNSHSAGQDSLSQGDFWYMEKLFACLPAGILCGHNCAEGYRYWNPYRKDSNGRQYCKWYGHYYYPHERQGCLSFKR